MAFSLNGINDGRKGCLGPFCADFIPQNHQVPFVRLTTDRGRTNFRDESKELGDIAGDFLGGVGRGVLPDTPTGAFGLVAVVAALVAVAVVLK